MKKIRYDVTRTETDKRSNQYPCQICALENRSFDRDKVRIHCNIENITLVVKRFYKQGASLQEIEEYITCGFLNACKQHCKYLRGEDDDS